MKYLKQPIYLIPILLVLAWVIPSIMPAGKDTDYILTLLILGSTYAIACLGITVVLGFGGQITLAQAAFFGLGAYVVSILHVYHGVPFFLAAILAVGITVLFGFMLGFASLKVSSHYLALVTIGFGIILNLVFHNWRDVTGGADGISGIPRPFGGELFYQDSLFLSFCITFLILVGYFVINLKKSRWGRALLALRENELAAEVVGVNTYNTKLLGFSISAALGGIGGILYASGALYISPDVFTFEKSILFFAMTLVGGSASVFGTVLGAFLLTLLPEWLRFLQSYYMAVYGLAIILVMIFLPNGIMGILSKYFGKYFTVQNHHVEPVEDFRFKKMPVSKGSATTDLLQVEGLVRHFGGVKAVDGVNLKVKLGEIHAIIGPNGCGKSTTLNLLSGIYKPMAGSIRFEGQELSGKKSSGIAASGISRTFQNIRLFPELTALENVMVGSHHTMKSGLVSSGLQLPSAKQEDEAVSRLARSALKFVGFDRYDELCKNLPYGQQRLVEIARAIVSSPRVLMLDEPAAGMNNEETKQLVGLLKRINNLGVTILLIEHDMSLVSEVADSITVIDYGKDICTGEPAKVLNDKRVIKAYLGEEFDYA